MSLAELDKRIIDWHLDIIKDERYSKDGRADAKAYINYLLENGTDSQKAYIRKQTQQQTIDTYLGGVL